MVWQQDGSDSASQHGVCLVMQLISKNHEYNRNIVDNKQNGYYELSHELYYDLFYVYLL